MTRKRTIATMAALGGFAAAVALLSGLPAAKADELRDLRANQELLQHRLDQLAQAPISPVGGLYPGGPPAASAGVGSVGGSFPRSFLIPGTDTSIRVGGQITEVVDYWFNGGNPNASPQTTTVGDNGQALAVPLHLHIPAGNPARSRSTSIFSQSPRESKLNFETRTPTAWGESRTFFEFDWAGSTAFAPGGANPTSVSDNLIPRLRFAYGTLGGFLAGQANSNFSDPDANGEVLDFGGNVGEPGVVRIPQVRYTMPLIGWGIPGAFSVSAETPETDAWTFGGIIGSDGSAISIAPAAPAVNPTKASAPDLTAAWYIPQPWGHMDFSAVIRPGLEFKDGAFVDRQFIGYGGHFGGDVKPGWFGWNRDDIIFQFTYGDGIGRYLNANSNFALVSNYPAAAVPGAALAGLVRVRTTVEWGGELGYQHRWTPTLRSNINAGISHHDISNLGGPAGFVCSGAARTTGAGGCGLNKEIVTSHLNLIWSPVPFVDVGVEYMYGHRLVLANLKGDENVLISKFAVKF